MDEKVYKSTREQILILQERGLVIKNIDSAAKILRMENYYKLINGYKDLFIDEKFPGEKFIKGTTFEEFYAVYLFDRELRNIFIKYILIIENNVKSVLAHDFSQKYGHKDYLKTENFRLPKQPIGKGVTTSYRENTRYIGDVTDLLSGIQSEISYQLKKNNTMISHYMMDYGYVPLWVLVNTLSLGTISVFYSYLKDKDQNDVARIFNLKPDILGRFLFVLTIFRNACAHDERFFSLHTVKTEKIKNSIKSIELHDELGIPRGAGGHLYGKNDLLAIVIIFKCMLDKDLFNSFFDSLSAQIDSLEKSLQVISIDDVLLRMGFRENWRKIKEL